VKKSSFVLVLHSSYFTTSDTPRQHFSRRDFLCPQTPRTQSRPVLIHAHSLTQKVPQNDTHAARRQEKGIISRFVACVRACACSTAQLPIHFFLSDHNMKNSCCAWRDEKRRCPRSQTPKQKVARERNKFDTLLSSFICLLRPRSQHILYRN